MSTVYDSCNAKFCIWNKSIVLRITAAEAWPWKDCPYYKNGCNARADLGNKLRAALDKIDFTKVDKHE